MSLSKTVRMESPCPWCADKEEIDISDMGIEVGSPGDVTICGQCDGVGVFTDHGTIRRATEDEAELIPNEIRDITRKMRELIGSGSSDVLSVRTKSTTPEISQQDRQRRDYIANHVGISPGELDSAVENIKKNKDKRCPFLFALEA